MNKRAIAVFDACLWQLTALLEHINRLARHNICSTWFLDVRISTCFLHGMHVNTVQLHITYCHMISNLHIRKHDTTNSYLAAKWLNHKYVVYSKVTVGYTILA